MPNAVNVTLQSALTVATFAAMAIPPEGLVIAGACAVVSVLISVFSSENTDSRSLLLPSIDSLMLNEINDATIREALAVFVSVSDIFSAYQKTDLPIPADINAELTHNPDGSWANFYNPVKDALFNSSGPFLTHLSLLQQAGAVSTGNDNLLAKQLPAFQYGVAVYLMLYKFYANIHYQSDKTIDPVAASVVLTNVSRWSTQVGNTISAFQQQIAARQTQVGPVTPFTYQIGFKFDPFGNQVFYFGDSGLPLPGVDGSKLPNYWADAASYLPPTAVFVTKPGDEAKLGPRAQASRQMYLDEVKAAMCAQNGQFDEDLSRQNLASWTAFVALVQQAQANLRPSQLKAA